MGENTRNKENDLLNYRDECGENVILQMTNYGKKFKRQKPVLIYSKNLLTPEQKQIVSDYLLENIMDQVSKIISRRESIKLCLKFVGPNFKTCDEPYINTYAYAYALFLDEKKVETYEARQMLNLYKIDWII